MSGIISKRTNELLVNRPNYRTSRLSRPAKGDLCPGCNQATNTWQRVVPEIAKNEPERDRHECRKCFKTPTDELLVNVPKGQLSKAQQAQLVGQITIRQSGLRKPPSKGERCPGCGNVTSQWRRVDSAITADEPDREYRFECQKCFRKPAHELKLNGAEQTLKQQDGRGIQREKPPSGTPCSRCGRATTRWLRVKADIIAEEPERDRHECATCFAKRSTDPIVKIERSDW